jgi:hypothetical protein
MSTSFDTSVTKISLPIENVYSTGSNQGAQSQRDGAFPVAQPSTFEPDRAIISEEALRKVGLLKEEAKNGAPAEKKDAAAKSSETSDINPQETRELERLKQTDREVRAHEQAHVIAGGSLVRGAASFGYATGPDGKLYAVSGEVSIDSSAVADDPSATISKMMRVVSAALAPAQPSGQDRAVASAATKTQVEAQQQLTQEQMDKMQSSDSGESVETKPSGASDPKKAAPEKKAEEDPKAAGESPLPTGKPEPQKQTNVQAKHINIQA